MQRIADFLIWYLVFVFSTTCHEAAHAFVARRGGDETAYAGGYASLDPLPHIQRSPVGMVLLPIVTFFYSGWLMGFASVPVNRRWMSAYPRRATLMALAGPAANLTIAAVAFIAMHFLLGAGVLTSPVGGIGISDIVVPPNGADPRSLVGALARVLSLAMGLNLVLGIFNLIPFPPLDGATAVEGVSPSLVGSLYAKLRDIPMIEWLGVLVAWHVSPYLVWPALHWAIRFLYA
jgi:Zn-dependent protease